MDIIEEGRKGHRARFANVRSVTVRRLKDLEGGPPAWACRITYNSGAWIRFQSGSLWDLLVHLERVREPRGI